jgi:DNA-binding MarR family transcriptional regulator
VEAAEDVQAAGAGAAGASQAIGAPGASGDVASAVVELVRLLNRPAVSRRLVADAEVATEVGATWALGHLRRIGPCRPSALAASLGVDASTVTHRLQELERAGYLERVPDPTDGRACLVALSAEGRAAIERLGATRRALFDRLVAGWPDDERRAFVRSVEQLRVSLLAELG